ncbi:MAG: histidine triad nucleotide-binding protein [Oscillospiraceae bacterium]
MCVFCKIINKEIQSEIVFEDDKILSFKDISGVSPFHILVIPKNHIESCDKIDKDNCDIIGYIFSKIPDIVKLCGITKGYRIVSNVGEDGGQTVKHLHFHILGGRRLLWPQC